MLRLRRPVRSIRFRAATPAEPEIGFPRAVAGEDFERYARAMRRQSTVWVERHWSNIALSGVSMHDVRETLRSMASSELGRALRQQEELLLSAVLHETWTGRGEAVPDIFPHWAAGSPELPPPAA